MIGALQRKIKAMFAMLEPVSYTHLTVHQDIPQKAHVALERLMKLIQGETLNELQKKLKAHLPEGG